MSNELTPYYNSLDSEQSCCRPIYKEDRMIHRLTYGTPCIYDGKTVYYNRYNAKYDKHLLYCSVPITPWPIHLYLNRNEFTIKGLKRDKDYEKALL